VTGGAGAGAFSNAGTGAVGGAGAGVSGAGATGGAGASVPGAASFAGSANLSGGTPSVSGGANVSGPSNVAGAPNLAGAGNVPGGVPGGANVPGANVPGANVPSTPGAPNVESIAGASVRPNVGANPAGQVEGKLNVDAAASAAGAGEAVGGVQSTQGKVASAGSKAQDPSGAATAAVDSKVQGEVSKGPVNPGAAQAKAGAASAAVNNPEAAGEAELRSRTPDASVNVSVGTGKPPTDPKK
jgi:hypothetical protein